MRRRRPVALALTAMALVLGPAGTAGAHTHLADLHPAPEAVLAAPPGGVQLVFNQPVDLVGRAVGLRSAGRDVAVAVRRTRGGRVVSLLPRERLGAGRVDVRFRVLSQDGHVLRGRYGFRVRGGAAAGPGARSDRGEALAVGSAGDGASRAASVAHGIHEALFVLAAGLLLVGPFLLGAAGAPWPARTAAALCAAAAAVAVLCASLTWLAADGGSAARALLPGTIGSAAGTSAGGGWLLRAGLWAAAAPLVAGPGRRLAGAGTVRVGIVAAIAVSLAISGHAGTHGGAGSVVADTAHLLAAAAWLGGLALLAGIAMARRADRSAAGAAYGRIALAAFAVLVLSGAANALLRLGGLGELGRGGYGVLVLAKLGVAAAIAAVAGVAALRRRAGGEVPAAQLGGELVLGAAAVALASILVETGPPS